ncbi:nuclear transport factor 2 family protein [Microlunatus parietis]|uniref:Ketosteroid isomerase-like protein n=1 Tax=Microlunatus parietis TaxID=682979 RepID=A0A7Y9I4N1_9ACTN|nr:nuclear transport factor 2 family protein [Microlunatus parietis]NYE69739.1 ketosteroid isomerase-like protein [Microlunatus parietis]
MTNLEELADRLAIEALRVDYTDAATERDHDRLIALFTEDGVYRIPDGGIEYLGRDQLRAGQLQLAAVWEFFVQDTHQGPIELAGDTATGRVPTFELGRFRDGRSMVNYGTFHDRYRRTADGWRFAEREYRIRYFDPSPLAGGPRVELPEPAPETAPAGSDR